LDEELSLVEMELSELQMKQDPMGGGQVLILAEKGGSREFAIWIGPQEALALDLVLHGQSTPRPLTHDLVFNVIDGLGGDLQRVIIDSLSDQTFYGKLVIRTAAGIEELIDTRPSDAMVLAMKRNAPIFVAEKVLGEIQDEEEF
jgi:bifunctional DNase/RNase